MKVLLPDSTDLSDLTLPAGATGVTYAVTAPVPDEHLDADVLVVWCNPDGPLRDAAARMPRLRLVQTLAAGPDPVLAAGFPDGTAIASGTGLHDRTVAEHTLALLLAAVRRLDLLARAQVGRRWAGELGGNQPVKDPAHLRTLHDAHVVIWGFGSIAATLAPYLSMLGARVTGVARSAGERHGFPVVTADRLPAVLPGADVLVDLLPATPATARAVNAEILALLPAHAWVVNVGRGATLDEDALLAALHAGRLGGAALDVTATEPLPVGSPLWSHPDVLITPHAAGGRPVGAAALIAANVAALMEGRALRNAVSSEDG